MKFIKSSWKIKTTTNFLRQQQNRAIIANKSNQTAIIAVGIITAKSKNSQLESFMA